MALTRYFPSGANGDAATAANTGGQTWYSTSGTGTISTTTPLMAGTSVRMAATSTSGILHTQRADLGGVTSLGFDVYFLLETAASGEVTQVFVATGSTRCFAINLNNTGTIRIRNAANTQIWESTYTLSASSTTVVRIAGYATQSATTGTITLTIYTGTDPGSLTQRDTVSLTAQNTGAGTYDTIRIGAKCATGVQTITTRMLGFGLDPGASAIPTAWSASVSGDVAAVAATGSGLAPVPTVSGGATVSAVAPTASGLLAAPEAEGQTVITGGGPMTASGLFPAPSVLSGSSVASVVASGTGQAPAPAVSGGAQITDVASVGTGSMPAPSVSGSTASTVSAVAATGSGLAPVPSVTGVRVVNISAVAAVGNATAPIPVVAGGASLTAVVMTAIGALVAPSVVGGTAGTVSAVAATGTGMMAAPGVAAQRWASVAAAPLLADSLMLAPAVLGGAQVPPGALSAVGSMAVPIATGRGPYDFQQVAKRTSTISRGARSYKIRRPR